MPARILDPATTLSDFFPTFQRLYLIDAAPKTLAAYRFALSHWHRLTDDPPLARIAVETLAGFQAGLLAREGLGRRDPQLAFDFLAEPAMGSRPGLRPATVNKHLRHINAMLAKCGPPGPHNRDALGLLPAVPWVKPLREYHRDPHALDQATLSALYQAAPAAKHPQLPHVAAGHWWQALIVAGYCLGFRRSALVHFPGTDQGITWSAVDLAGREVRLVAELDKCHRERRKPLHPLLVKHLLRIRGDWPHVWEFAKSEATFYRVWHAINDEAGLDRTEHATLHDLKRTAGTAYGRQTRSPWVVQHMLDHSTLRTSEHYVNCSLDDELRQAVEGLELPAAFAADFAKIDTA